MWQVVGQTRVVALLQRAVAEGAIAHAYLLVGPRHVGKMTLAINLAQAVNCQSTTPPCGECVSCQKIAAGKHADVQIIGLMGNGDAADGGSRAEISIARIREMQHDSNLPPFEGRCKVFIIDGAELLSDEAANCLLKTLEEPVGRVMFILLTTNDALVPTTVISRCQRLELMPQPVGQIEMALVEQWGVAREKAGLLARLSHGCLGWAIMALDDDDLLKLRTDNIDGLLDAVGADYEERFAYAARLAARFGQDRGTVLGTLDLWRDWWRDLLMVKLGITEAVTNVDRMTVLVELAGHYGLAQIRNFVDSIGVASEQLKQNANPLLVLETLMLGIPRRKYG